ncbi:sporulation protein YjcZ [Paenibacillus alvei]|nr:sporulation protein YjcZ [Paenibacillus alvei]MCY9578494.1 YjcZ family sporulation protein [Paenibacillus alvei]MCY9584815.1 YjcZ family sporulation protein [Paenibacillus alvei]
MSEVCGPVGGFCGGFTSIGVILVLFILLVIISRSWGGGFGF